MEKKKDRLNQFNVKNTKRPNIVIKQTSAKHINIFQTNKENDFLGGFILANNNLLVNTTS